MLVWIFADSEKPSNAPIMFSGYLHKWFLGATVNHKCLLIYDPAYKFGISLKAIWDNLEVGAGRLVSSPKRCHSTLTRKILAEGPHETTPHVLCQSSVFKRDAGERAWPSRGRFLQSIDRYDRPWPSGHAWRTRSVGSTTAQPANCLWMVLNKTLGKWAQVLNLITMLGLWETTPSSKLSKRSLCYHGCSLQKTWYTNRWTILHPDIPLSYTPCRIYGHGKALEQKILQQQKAEPGQSRKRGVVQACLNSFADYSLPRESTYSK